jgi:hypothetical protein
MDTGFVNLAPEFWPDFRRKVFGRYHHPRKKGRPQTETAKRSPDSYH